MVVKMRFFFFILIALNNYFYEQKSLASSHPARTCKETNNLIQKASNKDSSPNPLEKFYLESRIQLGIIAPWTAIGFFGGNIATKYTFDCINNYIDKAPQANAAQLLNHCHGELAIMAGVLTSLFLLKTGFKAISYICSIKDPWISDLDILIYLLVPLLSETYLSLLRKHIKKTYYSDKSKETVAYYPSPGKTPSQSP